MRVLPAPLLMLAFLSLGWLMLAPPVSAEQTGQSTVDQPGTDDNPTDTEAIDYPIGIFITSLHDLDVRADTFGVDYWVWSIHPPGRNPLETLEFLNAEEADVTLDLTEERGDRSWSTRRIDAVVRHDWDMSNYPFDRQLLDIVLEEGEDDTTNVVYSADTTNSGYNEDIRLAEWRITDFAIEERTVDYTTTFGDPDISDGSSYARLVASVQLERASVTEFFKLIVGVYAASGIGLLSFLLVPDHPTIFGARMITLVGSLFATLISLRASEEVVGPTESLSLVDKIHIVAVVYIFIAALIAVLARKTCESGKEELAKRRDRVWLPVLGISFVLINGLLIIMAAIAG